ncbi:MAG: PAS domain S-box protein [Candidatus Latescibacteria bacterium]|nr:PAS domain S-box protein [Candidatus Latescibacterota bacterium]
MSKNIKIEELEQRCREAEGKIAYLKEVEAREAHIKQVLLAIRNVNQLIVAEDDPVHLVEGICKQLTETIGYLNAWIVLLNKNDSGVSATAASGFDSSFDILTKRIERGNFPSCMRRALECDTVVVFEDPKTECTDCPLSTEYGDHTRLSCRINHGDKIYGILSVSVPAIYAKDKEERNLFNELTSDLAFALHKIEAVKSMRESQRDLKRAQAVAQIGSWRFDLNTGIVIASNEARRIYGLDEKEWSIERVQTIPLKQYRDALDNKLKKLIHEGAPYDIEFQICRQSDNAIRYIHSVAEYDAEQNIVIGTIQDITEQKNAEYALRESETNLLEAQQIALMGRWEMNQTTHKLQWSDTIFDIFEVDPATFDVNYEAFLNLVHPDDREMVNQAFTQSVINRQSYNVEHRLLMGDGRIKWLNERCRTDYDEQGRPIRSVGIVQDITERKQAEKAIRQQHERLEFVIDGSRLGTWSWNVQTNETVFNETWAAMLGYTLKELTPYSYETWKKLVHPDDLPQAEKYLNRCLEGKIPDYECEFRMKHKDRHWVWILDRGRVMTRDIENKPISMFGTHADITERKRATETIREREQFLRTILQTTADGFWVVDSEGKITEVNDAYCAMSGYERYEIMCMGIGDLDAEETPEDTAARIERIIVSRSEIFEARHRRKDGSILPVEVSATFMQEYGGQFVCFCRDMSERKRQDEHIELLGRMLDAAPAAITIHDTEGRFVYVNQETLSLHGYDNINEFLDINLHELDVPESEALLAERFKQIAEEGEARFEVSHYRKDGSTFPLEILAKSIDWHGEPCVLSIATDITDRKHAEEALRENEAKFRGMAENLSDVLFITNIQGSIDYISPSAQKIFFREAAEMIGHPFFEYLQDKQIPIAIEQFKHTLSSGERTINFSLEMKRKDGSNFWGELSASTLSKGKSIIGTLGVIRDITERKLAEEELRKKSEAMEASTEGMAILDADGKYIYLNAAHAIIYGYDDSSELVGKSWQVLYDQPELGRFVNEIMPVFQREGAWSGEAIGKKKDGSAFPQEVSLTALDDGGLICVVQDITERKKAENELQRHESQLQQIFEILPIGLWLADKDGTLLRGNLAGVKIWGVEPHMAISEYGIFKAWRLPSHEPVRPEDWALAKTIRNGVTIVDELLEIESFDGKRKTILNYTAPVLDNNGKVDGAIVINLDISDRQALENQLRQAHKMEAVGRLAGGVAHDFNNMLNVILGNTELVIHDLPTDSPIHDDLNEIRKAAERSADLTRQLLAFARRQTVAPKVLDLNNTIESMLKMLGRLIGEDIDLLWKPAKNTEPVRIDPAQVDQLLANLVVNARDAIGHNVGKVTIETDLFEFDDDYCTTHTGFVPGRYVMLAVSDDGCGMDKETTAQIFEPFFTTKKVGEGTGLGLSTVYGIVKQNHGLINVYSEYGQGTTFRIYLPVYPDGSSEEDKEKYAAAPILRGYETIMLVEDEPAILSLGRRMLERLGYHVIAASTPGEAIRQAEEHAGKIDLLITDVVMPEMNGRDVAQNLLSLYPNIKSLFMSGYTANVIAHQGVLDEGVQFIQKPFSMQDLSRKVRDVLDE